MIEGGLFEFIRDVYPVSTIMIILISFGGTIAYIPRIIHVRSLEKQLGIRDMKIKEQK